MALPWPSLAVALVLALGATLVLAARPERRMHVALAAALLLRAGIMATTAMITSGASLAESTAYARTGIWFTLALPLSTTLLAATAFPRRADRALLEAVAALSLAGALVHLVAPSLVIERIVPSGPGRYSIDGGPLVYLLAVAVALTEAHFVWRAARAAAARDEPVAARTRAAALGAALGLFPVYTAATLLALLPSGPTSDATPIEDRLFYARTILTGAAAGLVLAALPRLASPLARASRALVYAVGALVALLGVLDALSLRGVLRLPGYGGSLVFVRVLFALLLLAGAVRFGLADAGLSARRRVALLLRGALALALLLAVAAAGPLLLGANAVGALAGLAFAGAVGAATWRPLDSPARWLAARLLLAPDDPRAVAERARTYAAAVSAARGGGKEAERLLAALRLDLDISAKEHELLAEGLASRDAQRYRHVEVLGAGATANVELAVDEVAGRKVVVKRFKGLRDPAAVLREARALAAVKHPRVVPFLEVDRRDDEVYLVLAYAEGGSARQLLDKEGALPPARAVALALDLLDGLDALHEQGIVHCDVKAENLLLDRDGRGMLGDFGSAAWGRADARDGASSARFGAPDLADATLTGGAAEGSLSTISPEALRGAKPEPARDIYAAGALLYRLLTGQHYVPLAGATVFEARERIHLDAPLLPHPKVPAPIETVLRRALAKRPGDRYQSARDMRDALARALAAPRGA